MAALVLLTFGIALTGSFAAKKMKIPAGAMVGAILAVAVFNLISGTAAVPVQTRPVMQVMGGALLGHTICKKDLLKIKGILKAAMVLRGAFLFAGIGIPAGYMVGSVLFCGAFNIFTAHGYIPKKWRFWVQSGVGAVIGIQMNRESLGMFYKLLLPIAIMIAGLLIFTFLFAVIMKKLAKLDFQTCLLSLTPGSMGSWKEKSQWKVIMGI